MPPAQNANLLPALTTAQAISADDRVVCVVCTGFKSYLLPLWLGHTRRGSGEASAGSAALAWICKTWSQVNQVAPVQLAAHWHSSVWNILIHLARAKCNGVLAAGPSGWPGPPHRSSEVSTAAQGRRRWASAAPASAQHTCASASAPAHDVQCSILPVGESSYGGPNPFTA